MKEVRIIAKDPAIDISVPMGDGVATLTGQGLGGWRSVDRVENVALSDWEGQTQLGQDVPLMLDGWGLHPKSVQRDLDTLLQLGRDNTPNEYAPPVFQVWGPVHYPGKWWVLPEGGISLSTDEDEVIRDGDGTLIRQALTLHLLEYVHDTGRPRHKKKVRTHVGEATALTHVTSAGETLADIASATYGQWWQWKAIADANSWAVRSPFAKLPGGKTVILPRQPQLVGGVGRQLL